MERSDKMSGKVFFWIEDKKDKSSYIFWSKDAYMKERQADRYRQCRYSAG